MSLQQIRKFKWKIKYRTAFLPSVSVPYPLIYMGIPSKKKPPHRPQRPFLCHCSSPGSFGEAGRPGPGGGGRPTSAACQAAKWGMGSVLIVGM